MLDDRVLGRIDDKALARAFDEINEFEAQQRDYGTLIVKLYFDVSAEVQEQRLRERAGNPWRRAAPQDDTDQRSTTRPMPRRSRELRANSDTRWSPWRMIDGDDERPAAMPR